jgi:F0F1-type ATP synthase membrane subunit b/b'
MRENARKSQREKDCAISSPLVVVFVAFVLSGVLGTLFSNWISDRQSDIEKLRLAAESRRAAVQNLSRYMYERRARAEMLASSLRRNASKDEMKERKRLYDEAYV